MRTRGLRTSMNTSQAPMPHCHVMYDVHDTTVNTARNVLTVTSKWNLKSVQPLLLCGKFTAVIRQSSSTVADAVLEQPVPPLLFDFHHSFAASTVVVVRGGESLVTKRNSRSFRTGIFVRSPLVFKQGFHITLIGTVCGVVKL
jgi:hypothetical protein